MPTPQEDPLVRSSRREAVIVGVISLVALVYTLVYCGYNAYDRDAADIKIVFGFPDWVVWGVLVPWGICTIISIAFAFLVMTDDPLGDAADDWDPET